ncbi:uncharacterized protein LACBIDRAFT_246558 [Laccaria bicolor S238N-H82]|uniref:Predicted protein n=1 Tax=Laccaria bicolor (strain S238N-H82 / ATCC MYA-4686) TaxID=486041 RepID=B0CY72_LACBS|nr:uncharacterized protein LACBIDRAFT_246558 [Laccaria bicolor S238N-H82]EDR12841.1 predicted protein [Laccaria bicolor S238N-H82]|eukprot:XP_001877105.1 predicted protein [Laccaria bicolor S238N-H82]
MDTKNIVQWLSPYVAPFFALQYPTQTPAHPDSFPESGYYNAGKADICLVITCIAVMAVLRDALRLGVFEPFARWKLSRDLDRKRHQPSVLRFAEQGWSVVYYTIQWSFGLYVHRNLPTEIFDAKDLWLQYPHIPLAAPIKFYYLTQTAFYMHQMLILNAEARRKDHVQMMAHHIITVILMVTSYFTNFTRVGCVIMVLMDWCDIFLPLAKMIRYIDISQLACDLTFACFLVSWLVTRHFLFLFVIYSTVVDLPKHVPFLLNTEQGYYLTKSAYLAFCIMLGTLQVLQCIWFWMICRVAWRVITTGNGASDDRSDEEE